MDKKSFTDQEDLEGRGEIPLPLSEKELGITVRIFSDRIFRTERMLQEPIWLSAIHVLL